MKKSVILIITMIYIVSVVIVGFIGLKMRVYDEIIYVTDIVCTVTGFEPTNISEDLMKEYGCNLYYYIPVTENDITIEVRSRVVPDNATSSSVRYSIDNNDKDYVSLTYSDNIASITFKDEDFIGGAYNIKVRSTDGKNVAKVIRFRVRYI